MVTELNATKDNIYAVLAGILGGKWKVNGTSVFLDDPAGFSVGFARYTASVVCHAKRKKLTSKIQKIRQRKNFLADLKHI